MADKNSSTAPVPHEVPFIGASQGNAEAKPKRRRAAKIKAVPQDFTLTADEVRIVMAHRNLKPTMQDSMTRAMESLAIDPLLTRRAAPFLRLV